MPGYQVTKKTTIQNNGRKAARKIAKINLDYLVFIYDNNHYCAYDDCATEFSRITKAKTYTNADGKIGVQVDATRFQCSDKRKLEAKHKNYIIKHGPTLEIHEFRQELPETQAPNTIPKAQRTVSFDKYISDGQCVKLQDDAGEFEVILLHDGLSSKEIIHHAGGLIRAIQNTPIQEKDGRKIISVKSPLYQSLIGVEKGDIITCCEIEYKIVDFYNYKD